MQNYQNLRVSGRARTVVMITYQATGSYPKTELFGLTAQMRRASVSAGLNIVEGCSRRSTAELIRFLEIAMGSAMELEFCCVLWLDLQFGAKSQIEDLIALNERFQRELAALIGALRTRKKRGTRA